MKGERNLVGLVATAVHRPDGGKRCIDILTHAALVGLRDADDLEGEVAHAQRLSDERTDVAANKLARLRVADDQHLTAFALVDVVDETARQQLYLVDDSLVGRHAVERAADVVAARCGDGDSTLRDAGTERLDDVTVLVTCGAQVAVVERYRAALTHAVVGLRCRTAIHLHGVAEEVIGVVGEAVDEAVARTEEQDNHEDAPSHGEAGEGGAQLVALDGAPNLDEDIFH